MLLSRVIFSAINTECPSWVKCEVIIDIIDIIFLWLKHWLIEYMIHDLFRYVLLFISTPSDVQFCSHIHWKWLIFKNRYLENQLKSRNLHFQEERKSKCLNDMRANERWHDDRFLNMNWKCLKMLYLLVFMYIYIHIWMLSMRLTSDAVLTLVS